MSDAICDMHVHTNHSCDSKVGIEEYCAEAVRRGIDAICFTDHVDCNPRDVGYGHYNAEKFFDEFARAKEKYGARLSMLCGIEFAEPHLYRDELAQLSALPYDFILGTLHFWYKDMFPSGMVEAGIPAQVCYEHYWDAVLAAANAGGFDSLGHMDFPKRYYNELIIDEGKVREICGALVRSGICLEINTSSLRKNIAETMPGKEILAIYKSCGGKLVTVGSDAHRLGDLAGDNARAKSLIEHFGFEEVVFAGRKMKSASAMKR